MQFRQGSKIVACLLSLVLPVAGQAAETSEGVAGWQSVVQAFAGAVKAEQVAKEIPSLSAVLVRHGKVIWQGGEGGENPVGSIYRLGPVSAVIADLLILQLAEQGAVDLDDPVRTYLPEFPEEQKPGPTLRQWLGNPERTSVLGRVIERVTGKSYETVVENRIFSCLGLTDSGVASDSLPRPFVDGWYTSYDDGLVIAPRRDPEARAAEGLYGSVSDLGRLIVALSAGKDCGLPEMPLLPETVYGGSVLGHTAELILEPEEGSGVALLASVQETPVTARLAKYGAALMSAAERGAPLPSYLMTEEVPPEVHTAVVGYYHHDNESLILRSLWGKLFLEAPRVTAEVRQKDGLWYLDDVQQFSPEVSVDPQGKWVRFGTKTYKRMAWPKPEAPAADLAGLIGEYGGQKDYIRIYERDGRAWARLDWRFYVPLEKLDEGRWRLAGDGHYSGEMVTFRRDAEGRGRELVFRGKVYQRHDFGAEIEKNIQSGIKVNDSLRAEALKASPPQENGKFRASELTELVRIDPRLKLDIRYAGTNNFTGAPIYEEARAFLQRPAAEALRRANDWLQARGYGLLIHDGYRPWFATKMFWDATPEESRIYVANPAHGSRHNRGSAIDLTLYDLKTGDVITMPGRYDEFWVRSSAKYIGGSDLQRWHKDLLREAMESHDFVIYPWEWWHFDHVDWQSYGIQNERFPEISPK